MTKVLKRGQRCK